MAKKRRNIANVFMDMPLIQKMVVLYILIVLIPLILVGTLYLNNLSRQVRTQYRKGKEDILRQSGQAMDNNLAQIQFCANSLQFNADVLSYVEYYDFTTAEGADLYITKVRPVFEQLHAVNEGFDAGVIYRVSERDLNAARYVFNLPEGWSLQDAEKAVMTGMMLEQTAADKTACLFFRRIYNSSFHHVIGYLKLQCDFDYFFQALNFMEEGEILWLKGQEHLWQVCRSTDGCLYAEEKDLAEFDGVYSSMLELPALNLQLLYVYPKLQVLSDKNMVLALLGMSFLLLFFTFVYAMVYISITKRITGLTRHLLLNQSERMEPYRNDESGDEIGTLIRVFNETSERINELNREIIQKERLMNQAQYYAIQSQIHPHFLYNTLENIDMLIEIGENQKASDMIALFGKILRYNVSMHREEATLAQEVMHIRDYLKLYSYRMREDFGYSVDMQEDCGSTRCPYCMLQPVIENCFKHGFHEECRAFWVVVTAYREGDAVYVKVEDNGSGITQDRLKEIEEELENGQGDENADASIGLKNVHDRIRLLCGKDSGLSVVKKEQGCIVVIRLADNSQSGQNVKNGEGYENTVGG